MSSQPSLVEGGDPPNPKGRSFSRFGGVMVMVVGAFLSPHCLHKNLRTGSPSPPQDKSHDVVAPDAAQILRKPPHYQTQGAQLGHHWYLFLARLPFFAVTSDATIFTAVPSTCCESYLGPSGSFPVCRVPSSTSAITRRRPLELGLSTRHRHSTSGTHHTGS